MLRLILISSVLLGIYLGAFSTANAGRKNNNTLDWDPKKTEHDSLKLGGIIPDGDVYISAVDSTELKLIGYHVTNAEKDDFYYGELRLPAGKHTLVVYSIKGQESRSITAERGGASVPTSRTYNPSGKVEGTQTQDSDLHVVTKGGSGSKMLVLTLDVEPGEKYIIKPGKTTDKWKVVKASSGDVVDVMFSEFFESDE